MKFFLIILSGFILMFVGNFFLISKFQDHNFKQEKQAAYQKGYTDYQIDTYIPAPYLPTPSVEIPIKKRNPKLKEKFKGWIYFSIDFL
jgi:hypothetical protein